MRVENSGRIYTLLAPTFGYTTRATPYLQREGTVSTLNATITATLRFEFSEDREVSDNPNPFAGNAANIFRITDDEAAANDGVTIEIRATSATESGQTYEASVEIYYPIVSHIFIFDEADWDNDGVVNDRAFEHSRTQVLASIGTSQAFMEVSGDDSLVVLGNRARQLGFRQAEITTGLETLGISEPPGYEGQGVYDFAFFHSATTYTYVTVPLATTSAESKNWLIYDDGRWKLFNRDNEGDEERIAGVADVNEYYSAAGTLNEGVLTCPDPDPNDPQWTSQGIVAAGHQCVLLAIFDGGPNDGDGAVNGFVSQLGATGSMLPVLRFRLKIFLEGAQ